MDTIYLATLNTNKYNYNDLIDLGIKSAGNKIMEPYIARTNELSAKESIGARILLSNGLESIGIYLKDEVLLKTSLGKPYLKNHTNIHFSLSHSKGMVACAISTNKIGCDIEKIGETKLKIAKRFFNKTEYKKISSIEDDTERKITFYKYWTAKESYLKAIGTGLNEPLDSFIVDINNSKIDTLSSDNTIYYINTYSQLDDYILTLCSTYNNFPLNPINF